MSHPWSRRDWLRWSAASTLVTPAPAAPPGFTLTDITQSAGIRFAHNTGGFGRKYLPETLGPGCLFFDYDNDGWPDLLFVNGISWDSANPAKPRGPSLQLYRNNHNGTFTDVTRQAGLDQIVCHGLGATAGDFDNDGFPDLYITCVGQSRLLKNNGRGGFVDVTKQAGLAPREGFSTSALWFDYDHDGLLDLFVCNYVRWSPERDVYCSLDGKKKSYCTPEAYPGATCWLFRNLGGGRFEDVTAKAGLLDTTSKSLGVAMLDVEGDGWTDLFVANDTQPNKLYRSRAATGFEEIGVKAGVAFSEDGKARAGMGADAASIAPGVTAIAVTNFDNERMGLFVANGKGGFTDRAERTGLARQTRRSLGFGCFFFDADLDGRLDLLVANGHIDPDVGAMGQNARYAQSPQLFQQAADGTFLDVAPVLGGGFASPKVARGAAYADIDGDGDLDVVVTTNGGPAYLYRNDQRSGNRWLRLKLTGVKSNRDAIGALVKAYIDGSSGGPLERTVKSGSSYLSQSELPLTFGLARHETVDRLVVNWPSGRVDDFKNVKCGRFYTLVEGQGLR